MKTREPVPAVRGLGPIRVAALFAAALLLLPILASPAPAASGNGEKPTWFQGYVDKTGGEAILYRGHWYELAGARVVDAYGRPLPAAAIKRGAYIYMCVERGKVTYLRVFQDIGR